MNNLFKFCSFLLLLVVAISCRKTPNDEKTQKHLPDSSTMVEKPYQDKVDGSDEVKDYCAFVDSMIGVKFDSSTIEGKAKHIVNLFNIDMCEKMMCSSGDSLLDLNYDGFKDLVIYFYYAAGTGMKNGMKAYLFNKKSMNFEWDSVLSSLQNPSFYLKDKEITAFYIGHGGGNASLYGWKNNKWDVSKYYTFRPDRNNKGNPCWKVEIVDTKTNDTSFVYQKNNFPVPDNTILRNKWN